MGILQKLKDLYHYLFKPNFMGIDLGAGKDKSVFSYFKNEHSKHYDIPVVGKAIFLNVQQLKKTGAVIDNNLAIRKR